MSLIRNPLARHLTAAFALTCALSGGVWAQAANVKVEGAWARATVQGQKGTGAFMKITAPEGAKLVGASSPAAGVPGAEVATGRVSSWVLSTPLASLKVSFTGTVVSLASGAFRSSSMMW